MQAATHIKIPIYVLRTHPLSFESADFDQYTEFDLHRTQSRHFVDKVVLGGRSESDLHMLPLGNGVRVLKQDANGLIALYKPANVLSHPNETDKRKRNIPSLIAAPYDMREETYKIVNPDGSIRPIWLLHRLDSTTSGVMLVSTNESVARAVKDRIRSRDVVKHYAALVFSQPNFHGKELNLNRPNVWVDEMKVENVNGELRARASLDSMNYATAETLATVMAVQNYPYCASGARKPSYSLLMLDLQPLTGFTHQLRYQALAHKLPMVGDCTYGNFAANKEFRVNMSCHPVNYLEESPAIIAPSAADLALAQQKASNPATKPPFRNYFKGLYLHSRRLDLSYTLKGVSHAFSVEAPIPPTFEIAMTGIRS